MSRTGVARPAFPAHLRELQRQFATAEACQQYLTASRGPDGFHGPRLWLPARLPHADTPSRAMCPRAGTRSPCRPGRYCTTHATAQKRPAERHPSVVPLADRAIGNLQPWLIGTSHGVSQAPLPVDLDECVVRHNRRWTPHAACQTLLGRGTGRAPTPSRRIRHARAVRAHRGSPQQYWGRLTQPENPELATKGPPV